MTKRTSVENKEKYQLGDYKLIPSQILQTNITRTVWQTVRRITNEILRVKGLRTSVLLSCALCATFFLPHFYIMWFITEHTCPQGTYLLNRQLYSYQLTQKNFKTRLTKVKVYSCEQIQSNTTVSTLNPLSWCHVLINLIRQHAPFQATPWNLNF